MGGAFALNACHLKTADKESGSPRAENMHKSVPLFLSMEKEQVMALLDMTVEKYMEISGNCAQSAFIALNEVFELGGDEIVKALTPMPGLGEMGLTCGAVTGPLMAIGLVYGRESLADWEGYRRSIKPAGRFVEAFREEYGTTHCAEIHEHEFGKCFNLADEEGLKQYRLANGPHVCSGIVKSAVRMAADIILEKYT